MTELDSRKQEILKAIIDAHIHTAEPVGSETLAHRLRLGLSSATIRLEMAALEELGYLSHPHTSAGRVPTDRGYRVYVDAMLDDETRLPEETARFRRRFQSLTRNTTRVVEEIARALASATNYASVVVPPQPEHRIFRHLHLIPLTSTQVLVVIVTNAGVIQGNAMDLPEPVETEELDRLSRTVSQRLEGMRLTEISTEVLADVVEAAWHQQFVRQLGRMLRSHRPPSRDPYVVIEGTANILKQPEFQDVRTAQHVLSALERDEVVAELLSEAPDQEVWIRIGSENRHEDLRGCSIVVAAYKVSDDAVGALGIVGPTRMKYGKVIALVRYLARELGSAHGESP